jgi:hypothetical protein
MSDNIGKSAFPAVQACPAFPSTFHIPLKGALDMPCLIPCAIDQVGERTYVRVCLYIFVVYLLYFGNIVYAHIVCPS